MVKISKDKFQCSVVIPEIVLLVAVMVVMTWTLSVPQIGSVFPGAEMQETTWTGVFEELMDNCSGSGVVVWACAGAVKAKKAQRKEMMRSRNPKNIVNS